MDKMWVSFASIGFLFFSMLFIYLSRYKITNGILKFILALVAWILFIVGSLTMVYIVFSGPTGG